jgi:hypothetical protein
MISPELVIKIRSALVKEVVRRSLNKYFSAKGFSESFDKPVYPAMLLDMPKAIPELFNKVELQPSSENIDPTTGIVKIRWDLFVLGTNRMCLGTSTHTSLSEIERAVRGDTEKLISMSESKHTPSQIIDFILTILSTSKNGFEGIPQGVMPFMSPSLPINRPTIGPASAGGFYEKSGRA